MQKITISHADAGRRLDNYLQKILPGAGLSFLYKMLRKKNITVNGKKAEGSLKVNEGDEICIYFADDTYAIFAAGADTHIKTDPSEYINAYESLGDIDIIYEDEDVIFVDKPAGILAQRSKPDDISMNEWLIGYLLTKQKITYKDLDTFKPAFANRLDRNTSGLMIAGRSLKGSQMLGHMLKERSMHKYYLCIALGSPDDKLPVTADGYIYIDAFLSKDHDDNRSVICKDKDNAGAHAQKIRTGFKLVKKTVCDGKECMVLEVELCTGRSHQIRAQLSALGHPIAGDAKYGKRSADMHIYRVREIDTDNNIRGQLLHAYRVEFPQLKEWPALSGREFKTAVPGFAEDII